MALSGSAASRPLAAPRPPDAVPPGEHNAASLKALEPAGLDVCAGASSFLQSEFWARFKARFGWKPRAFNLDWGTELSPLLVLQYRLGPGFSFAYIPWGPELPRNFSADDGERAALLKKTAALLSPLLASQTVFIRFDVPWYVRDAFPPPVGPPFTAAPASIQPPDSVLVDLGLSGAELLARMKPKWRYNIGLAGKKGVELEEAGAGGLDTFYALYRETARRDRIAIHGSEYYRGLFEEAAKQKDAVLRLYLARHEGEAIAAVITLFRGEAGTYLYGASAGHKRNLMAPYALQWQAIRDAKAAGCRVYDLFGIAPDDNPRHPMAGLYRFKTGFGGVIIHRPGSVDYPLRPLLYGLFRSAEGLRGGLRDIKKKFRSPKSR